MLLLIRLAWRNMFRNTRRTALASLAIGVGLAGLIFTDALMIGMVESMIRTATDTFLGHGQIHAEGFRNTLEVEKTVLDLPDVLRRLSDDPGVEGHAPRIQAFGMVSSASDAGAVLLYGIDPEAEKSLSKVDEALVEGTYLEDGGARRILIGSKLAETLEVSIGDRVVVTVAEAETGELAQEMFRIGGIFHFNVREMDSSVGFVGLKRAQSLLGMGDQVHEVAVRFSGVALAEDSGRGFRGRYSRRGNEALGWRALMPQLDAAVKIASFSSWIVGGILFAVVALGIINTLFMSLYERMFEFGVLRAVGTRPVRMALVILFEAGALSVLSILIGGAVGFGVTYAYSVSGIDYVGIEFAGVTFRELISPTLRVTQFTVFPAVVFLFTLVAGIYPAVFASRLTPARAMRAHD